MSLVPESLRRKFVKDSPTPIPVTTDGQFQYFMDLYDPVYHCVADYEKFLHTVNECGGEQAYSAHVSKFVESMVAAITGTDSYKVMQGMKQVVEYTPVHEIPNGDVYHARYAGNDMISLDLRSGNFNALRSFDESAVLGCKTYAELAAKFTPYEYLQENKQIRQMIFGKTNPSKQVQIMKSIMSMICDCIMTEYPDFQIIMRGCDECIIHSFGEYTAPEALPLILDCIPVHVDFIKAEVFRLEQIHPERHYFVKIPWNITIERPEEGDVRVIVSGYGTPVFKSIPLIFFAQAFKNYFKMPLEENDFLFLHEGQLCRFMKGIYAD